MLDHLVKQFGDKYSLPEADYLENTVSRARRTVECAFGIIFSKWPILDTEIETKESTAEKKLKTICF